MNVSSKHTFRYRVCIALVVCLMMLMESVIPVYALQSSADTSPVKETANTQVMPSKVKAFQFTDTQFSVVRGATKTLIVSYGHSSYTWYSTDESIFTVERNKNYHNQATITAVGVGTADVCVVNEAGEVASAAITVTAKEYAVTDTPYNNEIERGDWEYISVSSGFKSYEWTVSDPNILGLESSSSDYKRKVVGLNRGTATVTVTNEYGESVSVDITVIVDNEFTVDGSTEPYIAVAAGRIVSLKIPNDYDWADCNYFIVDPTVVSLEMSSSTYAHLRGLKAGDTTMTVTSKYGEMIECKIHVYETLTDLGFTKDRYIVYMGTPFKLPYKVTPVDHNNKITFTMSSWYDDIISLSEDGVVTPLATGTAYVEIAGETYSWFDDDECTIEVRAPYFSSKSYNVYKNKTYQLKLTGANPKTTWTSSNTKVATVSSKGLVTAKKAGTAKITANSGGYKVTVTINVKNPYLSKTSAAIYKSKTLKLGVTGGTGTVKWKSSNTKVATVNSSGKVTGKKAGTATIYATVSGVTLKSKITVKNPELTYKKKTIKQNMSYKLKVNGAVGKVKWSTSNKKVATVSSSGNVTAKKTGTATIKAKVDGRTLSCKVTVKKNQITYKVNTDPNDYRYGEPACVLKKAYFDGSKLKVDVWVMNNRIFKAKKFDWIRYKVYTRDGKLIASKKFKNVSLNVGPGRSKKITLTFSGSSIKRKNVDLSKGVYDDYSYWYTYVY